MSLGGASDDVASLRQAVLKGDSAAAMALALLLKREGDLPGMLAAFEDADRLGSVDGAGSLGIEYAKSNRLEEAELAYGRCIDRGGGERAIAERTLVRIRRGNVQSEEVEAFISSWCRAADLIHGQVGPSLTPDEVAALSLCAGIEEHVDLDRLFEGHRDAFLAGVRSADESGSAQGAFLSGLRWKMAGDVDEAAAAFRRAAERGRVEARGAPAERLAAAHLLRESGNLEDAAECYRELIAGSDPSVAPAAHLYLALTRESQGDIPGALEHYLVAGQSDDPEVAPLGRFNRTKILERDGRIDEAIALYIEIATTTHHPWATPWAAHDAAVLIAKEHHDIQGTVQWYRKAYELATELENEEVATRARRALDVFERS